MKYFTSPYIQYHYVRFFAILIFPVLITSCKENKEIASNAEQTYSILFNKLINPKNLLSEDMFEISDIICPETNDSVLVSDISKCVFFDEKIYIKDLRHQFFIFSNEGKIIKKIYDKGRGPGQYSEITCFTLYKNNLSFFDSELHRFTTYDANGEFIFQKQINTPFDDFEYYNDSIILLGGSYRDAPGMLCTYNLNSDKIINSYFEYEAELACIIFQNFTVYKDARYFKSTYGQTFYEVIRNEEGEYNVQPKYYIDFNKNNFDKEKMIDLKIPGFGSAGKVPAHYMTEINHFFETDQFIYMNVSCYDINEDGCIDIYISKMTEKIYYNIKTEENDKGYLSPCNVDSENNFIATFNPESLSDFNSERLSPEIKNKIKDLKDTDNPVIVKYKLSE